MTNIHPSHDQISEDIGELPVICLKCRFEGYDLAAKCGDKADLARVRKKQDAAFKANIDEALISLADNNLGNLFIRPDLHAAFKRRLVERFERQTGKRWGEVKLSRPSKTTTHTAVLPAGVTSINVQLAGSSRNKKSHGGNADSSNTRIAVTPGETLHIEIGAGTPYSKGGGE